VFPRVAKFRAPFLAAELGQAEAGRIINYLGREVGGVDLANEMPDVLQLIFGLPRVRGLSSWKVVAVAISLAKKDMPKGIKQRLDMVEDTAMRAGMVNVAFPKNFGSFLDALDINQAEVDAWAAE